MHFFLTLINGNVSFSPFPEVDKLKDSDVSYLSPPLPLVNILFIQERILGRQRFNLWPKRNKQNDLQYEIIRILKKLGLDELSFTWQEAGPTSRNYPPAQLCRVRDKAAEETFSRLIRGRQLTSNDLLRLGRQLKIKEEEIMKITHSSVEQGSAQWIPAVRPCRGGWQCQRCGEKDVEEWPSIYGMAATCRSCGSIGQSSSLDVLLRDQRPFVEEPFKVLFRPHWVLTEAQSRASEQVLDFMKDEFRKAALLWAACGAGKTEVCFPAAAWALEQGKSVLFAAPRQDVINDIAPRIQRDFPDCPVLVLTGTAQVKFQEGGMVLATTHQILRFWRAFDIVFMDEMDAFPYYGNQALEWGLRHAVRENGKILYLTATPSPKALAMVRQGQMPLIRLPARHHRAPLPVPIWEKSRYPLNPSSSRDAWLDRLEGLRLQGPVLVFVPKISWINSWVKFFQMRFSTWSVGGSYSSDSERSLKLEGLRQGKFDLFVSTTILERGITLDGVQVVVLAADHPIFDERALVQMAGRVGRTSKNPEGKVLFVSKQMTTAMKTTVQWIEEQNRWALKSGLIDVSPLRG